MDRKECNHKMIVEIMAENWVREVCQKCDRVVEYYGRKPGTPGKYVGKWVGRKPKITLEKQRGE